MVKQSRKALDFAASHPGLIVFIVALVVRVGLAILVGDSIPQSPDKVHRYDQIAMNLINGKGFVLRNKPTAVSGPFYPVLLAGLYFIFGKSVWIVKIVCALFDALSCMFFYQITRKYFDDKVPFLTALALIFLPYSLYAALTVTIDVPFLLLHALFLFYLANALENNNRASYFTSGVWLGLATLCRAVPLLLPLFILPVTVVTAKIRKGFSFWLIFLAGFLLMVGPWIARNYVVFDRFIPVQTLGGFHLYSAVVTGKEFYEESLESPKSKQMSHDEYYYRRAFDRILHNPGQFLNSMGTRFLQMWYRTESGRHQTPLMVANFTLLGLAFAGLILTRKKWAKLMLFYAVAMYYILLLMALAALFRYALPIIPLLLPFAMVPLDRVFSTIKRPLPDDRIA
jgi:4-amino-4-deoxy-L-arabinose transferase-like glycosyltransferase